MALNPELIQFFFNRIQNSNTVTLRGSVGQLFEHLENEVKDNPVFDKYQHAIVKWDELIEGESSFRSYDWEMPSNFEEVKNLSYALYKKISIAEDLTGLLFGMTNEGNLERAVYEFNKMFLGYLGKTLDDIVNANPEIEENNVDKVEGNTVFIIHGHNELAKTQVQLLLTRAGVNNLVLHEQPDKGRTIIDKLVEEGKRSNYAIALMTTDDQTVTGQSRARQNVVLEIGFFMGQLGKERVRLLVADKVEIPSDLQGILYEKYDAAGSWRMKILKELTAAGIYVDFNAAISSI
jgi:predicted nucleotide-binding protein